MQVIIDNLDYLLVGQFPDGPIGGLAFTLYIFVLVGLLCFAVGVVLSSLALAPVKPVRLVGQSTTELIRAVPSLTFLFWIYFMIPRLLDIDLGPLESAVIALALYHGAYLAEHIRGGFNAVDKGQWEAGRATGLSAVTILREIVLPQAIRAIIPALVNRYVNLFIYTSIVSTLGIIEFLRAAMLVNNREMVYPVEIFAFVGIVYFIFAYALTKLGRYFENRVNRHLSTL